MGLESDAMAKSAYKPGLLLLDTFGHFLTQIREGSIGRILKIRCLCSLSAMMALIFGIYFLFFIVKGRLVNDCVYLSQLSMNVIYMSTFCSSTQSYACIPILDLIRTQFLCNLLAYLFVTIEDKLLWMVKVTKILFIFLCAT